jgi:preprotein translocase subunit SecG
MTGGIGGPMRTTALLATALLAITLILVFATAASAGPRQDHVWQPCDYNTDWKIDGTSCG